MLRQPLIGPQAPSPKDPLKRPHYIPRNPLTIRTTTTSIRTPAADTDNVPTDMNNISVESTQKCVPQGMGITTAPSCPLHLITLAIMATADTKERSQPTPQIKEKPTKTPNPPDPYTPREAEPSGRGNENGRGCITREVAFG